VHSSEYILLLLKFGEFCSPGTPWIQFLNFNWRFSFFPRPGPHVSPYPQSPLLLERPSKKFSIFKKKKEIIRDVTRSAFTGKHSDILLASCPNINPNYILWYTKESYKIVIKQILQTGGKRNSDPPSFSHHTFRKSIITWISRPSHTQEDVEWNNHLLTGYHNNDREYYMPWFSFCYYL